MTALTPPSSARAGLTGFDQSKPRSVEAVRASAGRELGGGRRGRRWTPIPAAGLGRRRWTFPGRLMSTTDQFGRRCRQRPRATLARRLDRRSNSGMKTGRRAGLASRRARCRLLRAQAEHSTYPFEVTDWPLSTDGTATDIRIGSSSGAQSSSRVRPRRRRDGRLLRRRSEGCERRRSSSSLGGTSPQVPASTAARRAAPVPPPVAPLK